MKQITVKPTKHLCAVPACKNTDTYKISGSPNTLGGLCLCTDCIAQIYRQTRPKKGGRE